MNLQAHELFKFELAALLRDAQASLGSQSELDAQIRSLLARLADDTFELAVVGRFSRGKSSLMNAILGMDRLPTGILPLTSVITSVGYSSREEARIEFEQGSFAYQVPLAELPDYVTEQGNPGNVKRVARARIGLPAELLRRGFHFVDTPGTGSAIPQNERTTRKFLPQADALLLVTGYDAPLSEDEMRLAQRLGRAGGRLFVVLNKQDLVPEEQRAEVMAFVERRLASVLSPPVPSLYSVSARDGLAAKLAVDCRGIASSGIGALETELTRFLIEEKSSVFLSGICTHTAQMLDAGQAQPSQAQSDLQALRERLHRLRARLRGAGDNGFDARAGTGSAPTAASPAPEAATPVQPCSMCREAAEMEFEFLRRYQFRLAASVDERGRFAERGGLCAAHLTDYARTASERDLSVVLPPLIESMTASLREGAAHRSTISEDSVPRLPAPGEACMVCVERSSFESRSMLASLGRYRAQPGAGAAELPSLCLPHLRRLAALLRECGETGMLDALLHRQVHDGERLVEDMQRYALKRDALRHGRVSDEEENAAKLAIGFLAGH